MADTVARVYCLVIITVWVKAAVEPFSSKSLDLLIASFCSCCVSIEFQLNYQKWGLPCLWCHFSSPAGCINSCYFYTCSVLLHNYAEVHSMSHNVYTRYDTARVNMLKSYDEEISITMLTLSYLDMMGLKWKIISSCMFIYAGLNVHMYVACWYIHDLYASFSIAHANYISKHVCPSCSTQALGWIGCR